MKTTGYARVKKETDRVEKKKPAFGRIRKATTNLINKGGQVLEHNQLMSITY
jgi:hypothetical protein